MGQATCLIWISRRHEQAIEHCDSEFKLPTPLAKENTAHGRVDEERDSVEHKRPEGHDGVPNWESARQARRANL
jgi:hypothetical protein